MADEVDIQEVHEGSSDLCRDAHLERANLDGAKSLPKGSKTRVDFSNFSGKAAASS